MHNALPVPEPHRPHIIRRIMAVVLGLASLGLMFLMWNVRGGIVDDFQAGWGPVWVIQGLLVIAFGAGAVVLWFPKNRSGPWRRILLWAVPALVVVAVATFFLAAD